MGQGARTDLERKQRRGTPFYVRETGACVACRNNNHCDGNNKFCECKICVPSKDLMDFFKQWREGLPTTTEPKEQ